MHKKIITGLVCGMLATSVGMAAPQVDVPKGEIHLEYTYAPDNSNKLAFPSASYHVDGSAAQYGLTYGFGKDYALYLGLGDYKTDGLSGNTLKLDMTDLQIQKKLDPNFAAFAGVKSIDPHLRMTGVPGGSYADRDDRWEVGIIGKTQIYNKTNAYTKIGLGKDLQEYKLGLTYDLNKNAQFDIGYGYLKLDDLDYAFLPTKGELTTKGLYYGLNVKF